MTCSSFPLEVPKQYSVESSPRQYTNSPRGDSAHDTKSPPSRFPEAKDLITCGGGGTWWGAQGADKLGETRLCWSARVPAVPHVRPSLCMA